MTPSPDKWITGRRPDVFPALVEYADGTQHIWNVDGQFFVVIRWQPWVNVPPPPVPVDPDEEAFDEYSKQVILFGNRIKHSFMSGVAYARESERKRFAEGLEKYVKRWCRDDGDNWKTNDFINDLRALAKGEKL